MAHGARRFEAAPFDEEGEDSEDSPLVQRSRRGKDVPDGRVGTLRRALSDVGPGGPCDDDGRACQSARPWNQFSLARKVANLGVASRAFSAASDEEGEYEDVLGSQSDTDVSMSATSATALNGRSRANRLPRFGPDSGESSWTRAARGGIPWQRNARRFYPLMFPCFLIVLAATIGPPILLLHLIFTGHGWKHVMMMVIWVPEQALLFVWGLSLACVVLVYVYHFFRLRGSLEPPRIVDPDPVVHAVVVCSYKEPLEVLCRTFESISSQQGIRRRPIAVFAAEARDETWRTTFNAIKKRYGDRFEQLLYTEHVLAEGEIAGKSSNENFAVRSLYRKMVDDMGLDPFEVLVTIADSDSLLSSSYLAHVEASFHSHPDGRRLIYSGPLNTYRNFGDADLLIQCLEMMRCHYDMFHNPFQVPYPYSNYSLTLGFAAEIGFWTPDSMPEDIHTANKAMVNNFGSRTTVAIPPLICNDLVVGLSHRYTQARRHQWGSVTELAWQMALYTDTKLSFPSWWAVFSSEACRGGSVLHLLGYLSSFVLMLVVSLIVAGHWSHLPERFQFYMKLLAWGSVWRWLWFWIAELTLWHTLMKQFPIQRPSPMNWVALIVAMPFLSAVADVVFYMVPTLHGLFHATFVGELAYVCAPKAPDRDPVAAI